MQPAIQPRPDHDRKCSGFHFHRAILIALMISLGIGMSAPAQQRSRFTPRLRPAPAPTALSPNEEEKPVVRAEPVPGAPEVRQGEELPPEAPRPLDQNPLPVRKALVIEEDPGKKDPPPPPPPITPSSDRNEPLEYANLLFSYEQYDLAILQYEKYTYEHPGEPGSDAAWYRLGECYLKRNDKAKAESSYRNQLRFFPRGDFAPAGAYRLGALCYERDDFRTAEMNFHIAEVGTAQPEIKLSAAYHRARCHEELGRPAQAEAIFAALAKTKEDNPYYEASLIHLARIALDKNRPEEALRRFNELAHDASNPAFRAEALVKSGLLLSDSGDTEKAAEALDKALKLEGSHEEWKRLAYYALIQNHYNAGEYEKVITTFKAGGQELEDKTRAKLLLMVGNAYRNLEQYADAISAYIDVERYYPEYTEGQEAGYRKLLCFHDRNDPELIPYIDFYVSMQREISPGLRYIDMALMLKAETLFAEGKYAEAASAYGEVRPSNIPGELRPARLYKLGWSLGESGSPAEAVRALDSFIVLSPNDDLAPSAYAQRGASHKALQENDAAIADFMKVTSKFPRSDAAEFAWQQLALTYGENRNLEKMIVAFESLLENFPETKAAAEACYWIGYGKFELKQFEEALAPLAKARELDAGNYHERATLRTILSLYYLEDSENLEREVDDFLASKPEISVPNQVIAWLGIELYSLEKYASSERFLTMASDPEHPKQTKSLIWSQLGKARIEVGKYDEAVAAIDFYLDTLTKPSERARALLDKSIAQLGMKKFDASLETAREALAIEKQGRVNAMIRMHLGDIAMGRDRYEDAAREYIIISEIFLDPEITPRAMIKAAKALEKSGDKAKADAIRSDLRKQFPDFKIVG